MDWKLEVVVVPVADVDRAKAFYAERVRFVVDHDTAAGEMRVVQLTPPGSGCSIVIGRGLTEMTPGFGFFDDPDGNGWAVSRSGAIAPRIG